MGRGRGKNYFRPTLARRRGEEYCFQWEKFLLRRRPTFPAFSTLGKNKGVKRGRRSEDKKGDTATQQRGQAKACVGFDKQNCQF